VEVEAEVLEPPAGDKLSLVSGVVVEHEVDIEVSGHLAVDAIQKGAELGGAVTPVGCADDLAGGGIERREERGSSVPAVVVSAQLGQSRTHRQDWLGPVQGLDLALIVGAEDERPLRRIEIQPNDVAHLLHQLRISVQLEGVRTVRLEPEGAPDPQCGGVTETSALAMPRVLHWVALRGVDSKVHTTTSSTFASLIRRGAALRGSSSSPAGPRATNQARDGPTVALVTRSFSATAMLLRPDEQPNTMRDGSANAWAVVRRRVQHFAIFGAEHKPNLGTATGALHAGALRVPGTSSTVLPATSEAGTSRRRVGRSL
jgi:hypothetical protein